MKQPSHRPHAGHAAPATQHGLTLIESLVAIIILGLGVLALLGVQLSTLAETQNSTRRAHAIRIMEDLSERIKSNPGGFAQLGSYVLTDWVEDEDDLPTATTSCAAANSSARPCSASQLAAWDLRDWAEAARLSLPAGTQLRTFLSSTESDASNRRQLGIMIGWPLLERTGEATSDLDRANVKASDIACPDGLLCHVIYVQP
ncbi:type IV pilus modification protein PilV [Corticibacter populi]|nr:type IV pilus modification protein PilV [Corticibacter populi]RZS33582.1 type IV pilus assembly protein PilV [Corticibacter populi]